MRAFCWIWGGSDAIILSRSATVYFFPFDSRTTVSGASGGDARAGACGAWAGGAGVPGVTCGEAGTWPYIRAENRTGITKVLIGSFLLTRKPQFIMWRKFSAFSALR